MADAFDDVTSSCHSRVSIKLLTTPPSASEEYAKRVQKEEGRRDRERRG